jgi:hypothetical protein
MRDDLGRQNSRLCAQEETSSFITSPVGCTGGPEVGTIGK